MSDFSKSYKTLQKTGLIDSKERFQKWYSEIFKWPNMNPLEAAEELLQGVSEPLPPFEFKITTSKHR